MNIRLYPDKNRFRECAARGNVVPVCMEILADTETPVSLLARLRSTRDRGPIFLLESVEGGERWGRYSFLGSSAHCRIRVYRHTIRVDRADSRQDIPHDGDPLAVIRSLMNGYRPVSLPELPRFWGGLVGYMDYEMVSFFENISHGLPKDEALAHFIVTDDLFIFDNVRHTLTLLVHAFMENGEDPDRVYDRVKGRLAQMRNLLNRPLAPPPDTGSGEAAGRVLEPVVEAARFRDRVSKVKAYIRDGEVIQAVISQPFVCRPAPDPWLMYRAQRYVNPSPYMFFLHLDDRVMVGSSPETMVRLENRKAFLRPIAGTRPRGATEQEDRMLADELLGDPKERAEHLMLVDLGRNDLGRVAETGTVQVTDLMVVERYSHVMHLVSSISCDLPPGCGPWDLIRAVFPAGTLSGAPKVRAMEVIAEQENGLPRGPYGGAVGYVSFDGNMDLAITIRTALIENGSLTVQAGAGIVADSDPELERQETVNKAMAIQRSLDLAVGKTV